MSVKGNLADIFKELEASASYINEQQVDHLIKKILMAKHIFLTGAGRSGLVIQAFANRLMHLGFSVSLVGEISSPRSNPGDLIIICSGSGETESLKNIAQRAKKNTVEIALVTMKPESFLGITADSILTLKGTTKSANKRNSEQFSQPMGSSFEQLAYLVFDSLVLSLMNELSETSEMMFRRHADFE